MKAHALEIVNKATAYEHKLNILREYLQVYILRILNQKKFFDNHAFVGGTALRLIYDLPRYSEDLDFTQISAPAKSFEELILNLKHELVSAGYQVNMRYNDVATVHNAWINFDELLFEAGISQHHNQKLSIKIEIDTNPPLGGIVENTIINKFFPTSIASYQLSSLFSGKLHAIFCRSYQKGRDFYDLVWYLTKNVAPNLLLLNNALKQTSSLLPELSESNWRQLLLAKIKDSDLSKARKDVKDFLFHPEDVELINIVTFEKLLQ